ncbi:MAG: molybdate ABC transporter substrate-binding protein [Phycisphaeraceae bacterium]
MTLPTRLEARARTKPRHAPLPGAWELVGDRRPASHGFVWTIFRAALIALAGLFITLPGCDRASNQPAAAPPQRPAIIHLSLAAGLNPVLEALRPRLQRDLDVQLVINPAGSGTLAQQIIHGAPCDLFISASPHWIDELSQRKLILTDSRRDLLRNRLVVIVPNETPPKSPPSPGGGTATPVHPTPDHTLRSLADLTHPTFHPIAIGESRAVPAGQYARQALIAAGVWPRLQGHLAEAGDVQAALMYVKTGQCPTGIVYATDAAAPGTPGNSTVRIALYIDSALHDPITYTAAIPIASPHAAAAQQVLDWLASQAARPTFQSVGFETIDH